MPSNRTLFNIFVHVSLTILLVIAFFIIVPVLLNTEITIVAIGGVLVALALVLAQIALLRNAYKAFVLTTSQEDIE